MSAKSKIRQIRVSPEEDQRLVELARSKGITVSDLLRDGALRRRVPARAAELEGVSVDRGSSAESGSAVSSGSAAPGHPVPMAPAADDLPGTAAAGTVAVFRCPEGSCGPEGEVFEARSPAVRCPVHGEKVVPA